MIAMTSKGGKMVRLSADFDIDTEKAHFTVYCKGITFEFGEFAPAARVYKTLSREIDEGCDIAVRLQNLVKGARAMGYSVKEVAR